MISTLVGFEITVRVSSDLKRSNEVMLRGDRAKLDKLTGARKPKHIRETLAGCLRMRPDNNDSIKVSKEMRRRIFSPDNPISGYHSIFSGATMCVYVP